jgi:hypothetical protein
MCWLVGCSEPLQRELVPVEVMQGGPPSALLDGASVLVPLAIDWSAADGSVPMGAAEVVDWTTVSNAPTELVLQTPIVPDRVDILSFADVDQAGIPQGVGRERTCDPRTGRAEAAGAECAFADHGDQIVVHLDPGHEGEYVVVQVAWLAGGARQVTESWGLHFSPRNP